MRSQIVLAAAEGLTNNAVAQRVGCEPHTVSKWRSRFVEARLAVLVDAKRPGRPRSITADRVGDGIVATAESTPPSGSRASDPSPEP
jgi:transposase